MMTSSVATGGCTSGGGMGPALSLPPLGISPSSMYAQLPACVSDSGHRFAVGLYHKDRACCERCGLIREAKK